MMGQGALALMPRPQLLIEFRSLGSVLVKNCWRQLAGDSMAPGDSILPALAISVSDPISILLCNGISLF